MKSGVLYISYDGMLEPLGQSQVLAYLERLAEGHPIHLISFEKAEDWARLSERQALSARIAAAGIAWHPLRYHKKPTAIATAWDIAQGTTLGLWLTLRHSLSIVPARRVAKWFERRFLLGADHVVSLTHAAVRIMKGFDYLQGRMPPFTVIPTCADL